MSQNETISNMNLLDDPIEYNPTAKQESSKIPDGTYLMSLTLGKYGTSTFAAQGKPCVKAHVEGKIVAPGTRYDGWKASGFLTSLQFKDGTSPLQQLLFRAGSTAAIASARELITAVEETLGGTPELNCKVRWETKGIKNQDTGKYVQFRGMKAFPQEEDGTYKPEIEVEINGSVEVLEAYPTIYGFAAKGGAATS